MHEAALASGPVSGHQARPSAKWHAGMSLLNLRGSPDDPAFTGGVKAALGLTLPNHAEGTSRHQDWLAVWAGPDDWFLIGPDQHALRAEQALRNQLQNQHISVTDVSSGYVVLTLSGDGSREALAQGCPLDLHPRVFKPGQAAGTHYFKASVWLWQTDEQPSFDLLVRRSFMNYVSLMLQRSGVTDG